MEYTRRYRFGYSNEFTLILSETNKIHPRGTMMLKYKLKHHKDVIFEGEDYTHSPLHRPISVESARGLIGFLSCQPGDCDSEYFKNYTEEQLRFVLQYGEEMSLWSIEEQPEPFVWGNKK